MKFISVCEQTLYPTYKSSGTFFSVHIGRKDIQELLNFIDLTDTNTIMKYST